MNKDYVSWLKENKHFLNHLKGHNSILYDSFNDVIKVMDYLNSGREIPKEIEADLFFDTGYAYLHTTLSELQLYLSKYFDNNLHLLLEFEPLIFFSFYLDEIKLLIIDEDKYTEVVKKEFDLVLNDIEDIIVNKKQYSDDMISDFNGRIEAVIPKDINYITIPEIFFRAAEELNIM